MTRLYGAVAGQVQHARLGRDFFRLTDEKIQLMRDVLADDDELYRPDIAVKCLTIRFGLDGYAPHTFEECARHPELPLNTNYEVQQVVNKNLWVLATHIVPRYAMETIADPAQIPLDYLQLSTRTRNALLRAKEYAMVADIIQYTATRFRKHTPGIGDESLKELKHRLKICGLEFAKVDMCAP